MTLCRRRSLSDAVAVTVVGEDTPMFCGDVMSMGVGSADVPTATGISARDSRKLLYGWKSVRKNRKKAARIVSASEATSCLEWD